MKLSTLLLHAVAGLLLPLAIASAADYPAPKEGDWIARDFRFHTGEVVPELTLHYRTIGDPKGEPVLLLHGSSGSGESFLNAAFAGELFGAGQPLDASKYYIILPDALGSGKSAKPSDGLRAKFPRYDYADMVEAQHRLVTEGLGIQHLRLVMGQSMGGMHSWQWGTNYPEAADALVPMACQPTEMAGRNWMLRRILVESIRRDPSYMKGDYSQQPASFKYVSALFSAASSGGSRGLYALASTHEKADRLAEERLSAPLTADANDFIYAYESSADYNPAPSLEKIQAHLLAINSTDDERNPPELGIIEREMKRVKNGRFYLIPGGDETRGHGTTGMARLWKGELEKLLQTAPHRAM
jgi:homoserine O-acetyltransferase